MTTKRDGFYNEAISIALQHIIDQKAREQILYFQRLANKTCPRCNEGERIPGLQHCKDCREKLRQYRSTRYKKDKQKCLSTGICMRCRKSLKFGRQYCRPCQKKVSQYNQERRERLKSQGLCTVCGKYQLKTTVLCRKCHAKDKERKDAAKPQKKPLG